LALWRSAAGHVYFAADNADPARTARLWQRGTQEPGTAGRVKLVHRVGEDGGIGGPPTATHLAANQEQPSVECGRVLEKSGRGQAASSPASSTSVHSVSGRTGVVRPRCTPTSTTAAVR